MQEMLCTTVHNIYTYFAVVAFTSHTFRPAIHYSLCQGDLNLFHEDETQSASQSNKGYNVQLITTDFKCMKGSCANM